MTLSLRQRTHQMFFAPEADQPLTLIDNYGVPVLVAIDVAALILESFDYLGQTYAGAFRLAEVWVVGIFTLEYVLRLWCCVETPLYAQPISGRLRYAQTPLALVDLAAFLPFFALNVLPMEWAAIAGPFFRLLRLLKLTRYSESTQIFFRVLRDKRDELLTTLFVVMTLLVIASSLMYFVEREAQPQEFSSIPAAMWWGVITLTTVGYGDVHPITPLGKFLSAILAFLGIGVFALPARDLAAAFSEEMRARRWGDDDVSNRALVANVQSEESISTTLDSVEASTLADDVEAAADLMQLCVAAAKRKLGDEFESEAVVRDLAIALFQETSKTLGPGHETAASRSEPQSYN